MSDTKLRLQFELTQEWADEFERLRREGRFESRKDLLNNSLTLIGWAMKQVLEGRVVVPHPGTASRRDPECPQAPPPKS